VHYAQELGANTKVVRNDDLSVEEALNMGAKAILLSPGPCTPNEAGICLDLIANAPNDLPILGICLGQQSIGQAFGGKVTLSFLICRTRILTKGTSDQCMDGRWRNHGASPRDPSDPWVAISSRVFLELMA